MFVLVSRIARYCTNDILNKAERDVINEKEVMYSSVTLIVVFREHPIDIIICE